MYWHNEGMTFRQRKNKEQKKENKTNDFSDVWNANINKEC